jgi:hypothetical protein
MRFRRSFAPHGHNLGDNVADSSRSDESANRASREVAERQQDVPVLRELRCGSQILVAVDGGEHVRKSRLEPRRSVTDRHVGIIPTNHDGIFTIVYRHQPIHTLDPTQ